MFFKSWDNLIQVAVVSALVYIGLVTFLRFSGKRTLSSMNAFDFIVTVAFGSTLASTILPSTVTLADGLLALGMLIILQLIVAWIEIRSSLFHNIVTSHPAIIFFRGEFVEDVMRRERVEHGEILAIIRRNGILDLDAVEAVVLETDGSFSVLAQSEKPISRSSLRNLKQPDTR